MVVKTIVVRNLFSIEYDGSNPSLSTTIKKTSIVAGFLLFSLTVVISRGFGLRENLNFFHFLLFFVTFVFLLLTYCLLFSSFFKNLFILANKSYYVLYKLQLSFIVSRSSFPIILAKTYKIDFLCKI